MKHPPASVRSKFIDGIRIFNKTIFNRITLRLTESGKGPFSIICHIGRQSGRTYRTPVFASYNGETIIIPLSYGENVDWLRNILAQGGCEIIHKKKRMSATNPEVIDSAIALTLLPEKRREVFERFNLKKFVRLQIIERK